MLWIILRLLPVCSLCLCISKLCGLDLLLSVFLPPLLLMLKYGVCLCVYRQEEKNIHSRSSQSLRYLNASWLRTQLDRLSGCTIWGRLFTCCRRGVLKKPPAVGNWRPSCSPVSTCSIGLQITAGTLFRGAKYSRPAGAWQSYQSVRSLSMWSRSAPGFSFSPVGRAVKLWWTPPISLMPPRKGREPEPHCLPIVWGAG